MPSSKRPLTVLLFIVLLLGIGVGSYFFTKQKPHIDKNKRQVVVLTNNQVLFGYLSNPNGDYVTLTDVYYPQSQDVTADAKRKITLKPYSDSYTTENVVYIQRDNILHFENLADGSKVTEAIDRFKENPNATPSPLPSP